MAAVTCEGYRYQAGWAAEVDLLERFSETKISSECLTGRWLSRRTALMTRKSNWAQQEAVSQALCMHKCRACLLLCTSGFTVGGRLLAVQSRPFEECKLHWPQPVLKM